MKKILFTLTLLGSVLFAGDFEDALKLKKLGDSYVDKSFETNDIDTFSKGQEYRRKAAKLFLKEGEKNNVKAYVILAYMYLYGDGVKRDYYKQQEFLKKAADLGDFESKSQLAAARIMFPDRQNFYGLQESIEILKELANKGHKKSQIRLGIIYSTDDYIKKDLNKSKKFNKMASE